LFERRISKQELIAFNHYKTIIMFVDPAIGTITIFAGNFAPQGWMFCQGQLLDSNEYGALYSILGTTYGGDGNTFALPDFRGRVAVHAGQAPGMAPYTAGEQGGVETTVMTATQMPVHNHLMESMTTSSIPASAGPGNIDMPTGNYPAQVNGAPQQYSSVLGDIKSGPMLLQGQSASSGESNPINIVSPYLSMNYVICVDGIYPSPPDES
jgi:microcystin-dependent protein